jgi:Cd2+/Zn2+-exporting ATPase
MKNIKIRISISGALFLAGILLPEGQWPRLTALMASYAIIGYDILWRAIRNILRGQVFDENFLMSIATVGAIAIGEYPEGVAVMLFYQVGEAFQSYAVAKSRRSIASLMDIRPDYANLVRGDVVEKVNPEDVRIGETILVRPGEKIPLDGVVLEGRSTLNTSALTGESLPRDAAPGDSVLSGCININGVLTMRVEKEFGESTVSKILNLVENAAGKKSNTESFITRFAAVYTPIVVISAALLASIPPLVIPGASFTDWLYRALTFLVVSCPCALVISIPLSFFGGIGGASRAGVLVKGGNYLEALARTGTVVFDKTGTLTKGVFEVDRVVPEQLQAEELLELAAYAESHSTHPISLSLQRAYKRSIDLSRVTDVEEIPGQGITAHVDGRAVLAGNPKLMQRENIAYANTDDAAGTVVHVAVEGTYAGYIVIADHVKEDSAPAIRQLRAAGIHNVVMLTGDNQRVAHKVAGELGVESVYAELLPGDKVDRVEALLNEKRRQETLVFVGDGINDAPVLARADVGVAMGGVGSDAAIEAADVVIMTDEPSKIAVAIRISRKTLGIANQNIIFAIGVKVGVLLLSAVGFASMWSAVFADVGVSVLAILNAMRALKTQKSLAE